MVIVAKMLLNTLLVGYEIFLLGALYKFLRLSAIFVIPHSGLSFLLYLAAKLIMPSHTPIVFPNI